jgi:hypothetical protein
MKPLLRIIIQRIVKKMVNNQGGGASWTHTSNKPPKKEGTIEVDYVPQEPFGKQKKPNSPDNFGEYVDYEEVR